MKWIVVRRTVKICVSGSEVGIRYHLIKRRTGGGFGGNEIGSKHIRILPHSLGVAAKLHLCLLPKEIPFAFPNLTAQFVVECL